MTPEVQSTGADELRLEVSREICRRLALPWFQKLGWHLDQMTAEQAIAVIDLRSFRIGAEEEIFSEKDLKLKRDKFNDWMFNLSAAFKGEIRSDCLPAIIDSTVRHQVPRGFLFDCLTGIESCVYGEKLSDLESLRRYCFRRSGTFCLSVAQILGAGGGDDRGYFAQMGVGLGILEILLEEMFFSQQDWLPIPDSWLAEQGITRQQILERGSFCHFTSLIRRLAIQGIEELGSLPAPPSSLGESGKIFSTWVETSLNQLHDIYSVPQTLRR